MLLFGIHWSHSQNDSGDLRGVAGGDGELVCLFGKAGTGHLCDGSAHSSGCVVNGFIRIHWILSLFNVMGNRFAHAMGPLVNNVKIMYDLELERPYGRESRSDFFTSIFLGWTAQ